MTVFCKGKEGVLAAEVRLVEEPRGRLSMLERGGRDGDLGRLALDDLLCERGAGLRSDLLVVVDGGKGTGDERGRWRRGRLGRRTPRR